MEDSLSGGSVCGLSSLMFSDAAAAAAAVVVADGSCCKESCSATSSTRPSMKVCLGHPMRIVVGYLW